MCTDALISPLPPSLSEILTHIESQSQQLRQLSTSNKSIVDTLSTLFTQTETIITLLQNVSDTHEWQDEISRKVLNAVVSLLYESNIQIGVCGCASVLKSLMSKKAMIHSLSRISLPVTSLHVVHSLLLHTLSFLSSELVPPQQDTVTDEEKQRKFQSRASFRMSREFPKDQTTPSQPTNQLRTSMDVREARKKKLQEDANAAGLEV